MQLVDALREAGVEVEVRGDTTAPTASVFGKLERGPDVTRDMLYARPSGRVFLVVPLWVYREGEIAEEWVFLGPWRDPWTHKWPTFSLRLGVSRSRESRPTEPVPVRVRVAG